MLLKHNPSYEIYLHKLRRKEFGSYLKKLAKKFKTNKIIIYGAGLLFQVISDNFDLSDFNIVGISDIKFADDSITEYAGYKTIAPDKLINEDFDVLLVALACCQVMEINLKPYEKQLKHIKKVSLFKKDTIQEIIAQADKDFEYY